MQISDVQGVRVAGVVGCVPPHEVPNEPKMAQATGIVTRRVAETGVTGLDLAVCAARELLARVPTALDDIGAVVSVSFTQPARMPCNAAQAQHRLGLPTNILAFDILQACAGYPQGLYVASLLVRSTGRKVLLLDGDGQSAFMTPNDAATSPVLADGSSATLLVPDADAAPMRFAFSVDGAKGGALRLPHGGTIAMDGFAVFRFVATDVVRFLKAFLVETQVTPETLDAFVPHQANVYMVRQLTKSLGIPTAKLRITADRFGNLSSASVPVTLADCGVRGERVLLAGFGGGLTISAALLTLAPQGVTTACVVYA